MLLVLVLKGSKFEGTRTTILRYATCFRHEVTIIIDNFGHSWA